MVTHRRVPACLAATGVALALGVGSGIAEGAASGASPACTSSQLAVRAYAAGGGLGQAAEVFVLSHHGNPCVLRGYPRLRRLDGRGSPIGTLAVRSLGRVTGSKVRVRTVRLVGPQKASFEMDYTDEPSVLGPRNRSCESLSWMRVQVGRARRDVAAAVSPCGGRFSETPVQPGVLAPERNG